MAMTIEELRSAAAAIRILLQKYGTSKLSAVDSKHYEALLKDAKVVSDAHTLCEYKLKKALDMEATDPAENLTWYNEEMEDCANGYAVYILEMVEAAKENCADPKVLIEQCVDFSRWVEHGFGTADCIIIADGTLRICDYKHGLGVLMDATDNPQMKCYALGALELFDDIYDIDTISMTIYQTRRQNISTFEIFKNELYKWANEVLKPTADLAFAGDGNFLCGEWCGFCKVKHECRARAEANFTLAQYDFSSASSSARLIPPIAVGFTDGRCKHYLIKLAVIFVPILQGG